MPRISSLISFAIFLVISVITALLSWALGTVGAFIGLIFSMFGTFLLQAALVKAVQDVRDGRVDLDLGQTVSAALPFVGSVAVASILASIGIGIGFVLIIVPGLILLTFWSLIVPEIVIGGAGALESFGRSWRTVRGYAWNVFGTYILVFLILIVGEIVLSVILRRPALRLAQLHLQPGDRHARGAVHRGGVTLIYYRLTAAHGGQPEPGAATMPGAGGRPVQPAPYGQPPSDQGPYGQAPSGQPPSAQGPYGQPPYGQEPPTVQSPVFREPQAGQSRRARSRPGRRSAGPSPPTGGPTGRVRADAD